MSSTSSTGKRWRFWKRQPDKNKKDAGGLEHECLMIRVDEQSRTIVNLKNECERLEQARQHMHIFKSKCQTMETKMAEQTKQLEIERLKLEECLQKTKTENKLLLEKIERLKNNDTYSSSQTSGSGSKGSNSSSNKNSLSEINRNQESNNNDTTLTYKRTTDNKDKNSKHIMLNEMDKIKKNITKINATNHMDNKLNNDNNDNTLDLTSITNNYTINHNKASTKFKNSDKNSINTNNNEDTLNSLSDVACNKCDLLLISQQKYIAQIESLRQTVSRLEKENLLLLGLFQECMNANGMSFDSRAVTSISPPPGYNHLSFDSTLTNGYLTRIKNINNNNNNNIINNSNNISYNCSNNNINNRNKPTSYVTENDHSNSLGQTSNNTSINNKMVNKMIDNTQCLANQLTTSLNQTQASPLKSPLSDDGNVSDQSILSQTLGNSSQQSREYFKDSSIRDFNNHGTRIDTRRRSSLSLNDFLDGEIGSELERSNNFDSIDLFNHNYPCDFSDPFKVFSEPFNELTSGFSSFESDLKTRSGRDEFSISSKSTFLTSTNSLKRGQNGFVSNEEDFERTLKRGTQKESSDCGETCDWVEKDGENKKIEEKKIEKDIEEKKNDEYESEVCKTDSVFVNKTEEYRKSFEIAKVIDTKNAGVETRGLEGIVADVNSEKDEERNGEVSSWEVSSMSSVECSSLFVGSYNEHEEKEMENENSSADEVFKNDECFTRRNDVFETNNETFNMTFPNVNVKTSTENVSVSANNSHNITENSTSFLSFNSSNNPAYTQESSEDEDSQSPFLKRLQSYFNEHPSIDDSLLGSRRRIHEKRKSLDDSFIRSTSSSFYPNKPLLSDNLRVDLRVLRDKLLNNDKDQMELRKMINLFRTNEGHAVLSDNVNSVFITKDKVSALKNYFEGKTTLKMSRRKKFKSVDVRNCNKINLERVDKNNVCNNSKEFCIHNSADNNVRNKQNLNSIKCEIVDSTTTTIASNKYKITKETSSDNKDTNHTRIFDKDTNHTRIFDKDKHTTNSTSLQKSCSKELNHFVEENCSKDNDEITNSISKISSTPKTPPIATLSSQFTKKSPIPPTTIFPKTTITTTSHRNNPNLLFSSPKTVSSPHKSNNLPKSNNVISNNNNNTKHSKYQKSPMSIKRLELDNKNSEKNFVLKNQNKLKTQTTKPFLILTPKQTRKNTNNKPNAINKKTICENIVPASPQKQCKSKRNIEKSPMLDKKSMKPVIPNKPKNISEHKTSPQNKIYQQKTTHKNATHTASNTTKHKHQSSTTSPFVKISMRSASVPSPLMPLKKNKQLPSFTIAIAKTTSLRSFALKQFQDKNSKSRFVKETVINENFLKDSSLTASSSILNDIDKYKLNATHNNTLRSYTPKSQITSITANDYSYNDKFFSKDLSFVQEIVSENGKRRLLENNFEKREDIKEISRSSSSSSSSIYWVSDKASSNINSPDTLKREMQLNKNILNESGNKHEYDKNVNTTDATPNVRSEPSRKFNDNSSKDTQSFVASTPPSSKLCKPSIKIQKRFTNDKKGKTMNNNVSNNNLKNNDQIKTNSHLNNKPNVHNNIDKPQNNKKTNLTPRNNRSKAIKQSADKTPNKASTATCACRNKAAKDLPRPLRQKTSAVKTNGSVMLKSTSSSIRTSSSSLSSEPTHHSLLSLPYVARGMYVENMSDPSHDFLNGNGMEKLESCIEKENKNVCEENLLNNHIDVKGVNDLAVNMIPLETVHCNLKTKTSNQYNKIQKEIILKRKVENNPKIPKTVNNSSNPFSKTSILSKEPSRGWMRRKLKSSTPSCMRMSPEVLSLRNHNVTSKPSINPSSTNPPSINHLSINHSSINQKTDKPIHSTPSYSPINQSHSFNNLQNSSNNYPCVHSPLKSPYPLSSNIPLNISRLPLSVFKAY